MSKNLNAEIPEAAPQAVSARIRRPIVYSAILGGLFFSLSQVTTATHLPDTSHKTYPFAEKSAHPQAINTLKPANISLKSRFIRNIRAAIAAKWQAKQLDNLINAITVQPTESSYSTPKPENSLKPFIGHSLTYDSNVIRAADGDNFSGSQTERNKSDFIKQIRAGIAAKWSIKRQVLLIKAIITQNWYSTFKELDYLGRDLSGQWNWQFGNDLTGEIGLGQKVSRGSFSQINRLTDNLQTENRFFAKGEYQFIPDWFLHGGLSRQELLYASEFLQVNNNTENAAEFGIKYLTPSSNKLGTRITLTDGRFPKRNLTPGSFDDNAYTRKEFNIDWAWKYSIKTRIDGRVGYTQQTFANISERDFSAPTARANINWEITGKSALLLSYWREIGFVNNVNANFILSQGVRLNPAWLATPKLHFTLPLSYETQDYLGDPGFSTASTNAERDTVSKAGLNLDYLPFDNAKMSLFMELEDRSSNNAARNYQSKAVGLDMQLDF